MPLDTIYIARHGFRLNWVSQNWRSETGLERDPPLAAYGVAQAKQHADWILSFPEEKRPTAIFCSPFYRTLQTATPIASALGIPIYVEHGIAEWYAPVAPGTGLHPRPGTATFLKQYFPLIDPCWRTTWYPSRKGEDMTQVHDRTADFLRAFFYRLDHAPPPPPPPPLPPTPSNNEGEVVVDSDDAGFGVHSKILFMGHAASAITLVRELVGNRDLSIRVGCCSLTTLIKSKQPSSVVSSLPNDDETPGLGQWDMIVETDAHFLDGGVERDWGFEDVEVKDIQEAGLRETVEEEEEVPGSSGLQVQLPDLVTSLNSSRL